MFFSSSFTSPSIWTFFLGGATSRGDWGPSSSSWCLSSAGVSGACLLLAGGALLDEAHQPGKLAWINADVAQEPGPLLDLLAKSILLLLPLGACIPHTLEGFMFNSCLHLLPQKSPVIFHMDPFDADVALWAHHVVVQGVQNTVAQPKFFIHRSHGHMRPDLSAHPTYLVKIGQDAIHQPQQTNLSAPVALHSFWPHHRVFPCSLDDMAERGITLKEFPLLRATMPFIPQLKCSKYFVIATLAKLYGCTL